VRERIPSAAGLTDDGALDDLHIAVESIGRGIGQHGTDGLKLLGPAHAAARDGQSFAFGEVFEEYVLLRRNLRDHVVAHLGRPLNERESDVFQSAIDAVVGATLVSLANQREGRARLEIKALGDFLASMAHDLRNEIGSVLNLLRLIEETGQDVEEHLVGADQEAMKRLKILLSDVQHGRNQMESTVAAMTRLLEAEKERNRLKIQRADVTLRHLLEGIARSAERLEIGRIQAGLPSRIVVKCDEGIRLSTDGDLLSTILMNLVGNAVKYARTGPITLAAMPEGDNCRIAVTDEGPGMAEPDIGRIFGQFERLGRQDEKGVGLGMFVARRAAALLGTVIEVQSVIGHGSTFSFVLPRK
jgi:two-component system, sensor histidine kinase LadS